MTTTYEPLLVILMFADSQILLAWIFYDLGRKHGYRRGAASYAKRHRIADELLLEAIALHDKTLALNEDTRQLATNTPQKDDPQETTR